MNQALDARVSGEQDTGDHTRPAARPHRLSFGKKLFFSVGTTIAVFVAVERVLWAAGVRPYRDVHDPVLDFAPGPPLFTRAGEEYRTTESRLTYFNAQTFAASKPDRGVRIFCLGGSTTFGHPYDDRTSYVGWLRELLPEADATRTWEVINCGGISYASYRLARMMDELCDYEPDVFIIYTGQNEFLEERTYGHLKERNYLAAAASRLRISTLLGGMLRETAEPSTSAAGNLMPDEVDAVLDHTVGPTSYERDEVRTEQTVAHFRANLARMCRNAQAAGARVILVKPASNLRDCAPFKSAISVEDFGADFQLELQISQGEELLRAGNASEALELFERAAAADPRHAQAAYLAGRAAFGAGQFEKAERYFRIARDEDVCPLRATSAILQAVEQVGREEQVAVIDFSTLIEAEAKSATGCSSPGEESFLDHVHPTVERHLQLALELMGSVQRMGLSSNLALVSERTDAVYARVMAGIDQTDHGRALTTVSQVYSWAGRDEEALRLAVQAAQMAPGDVDVLAQLGRMYDKTGQADLALRTYEQASRIAPENPLILYRLGRNLMAGEENSRALELLEEALEKTPRRAPRAHRIRLLEALGTCYQRLGKRQKSEQMFRLARAQ